MRQIISILILTLLYGNITLLAQNKKEKYEAVKERWIVKDGVITLSKVIELSNLSKQELSNKVQNYFNHRIQTSNFNSNKVSFTDDKYIVREQSDRLPYYYTHTMVLYNYTITVKDGKIKATIIPHTFYDIGIERNIYSMHKYSLKEKKFMVNIAYYFCNYTDKTFIELENFLKSDPSNSDNDW